MKDDEIALRTEAFDAANGGGVGWYEDKGAYNHGISRGGYLVAVPCLDAIRHHSESQTATHRDGEPYCQHRNDHQTSSLSPRFERAVRTSGTPNALTLHHYDLQHLNLQSRSSASRQR
jgi:hypothetical protein